MWAKGEDLVLGNARENRLRDWRPGIFLGCERLARPHQLVVSRPHRGVDGQITFRHLGKRSQLSAQILGGGARELHRFSSIAPGLECPRHLGAQRVGVGCRLWGCVTELGPEHAGTLAARSVVVDQLASCCRLVQRQGILRPRCDVTQLLDFLDGAQVLGMVDSGLL